MKGFPKLRVYDQGQEEMGGKRNMVYLKNIEQMDDGVYFRFKRHLEDVRNLKYMQYTGLTDCNGVEMYEGDILMGHDNPVDLVRVAFGQFGVVGTESETIVDNVIGWHVKVISTDAISQAHPFCLDMPLTKQHVIDCEWEIIGNIHENPELLHRNKTVQEQCKEWKNE